jgi:uncharacterized protein (DUF2141 family)
VKGFAICLLALGLALLASCASVEAITGGPLDKTPPQVTAAFPAPRATLQPTTLDIRLQFSEWIMNPVPSTVVRISPPLEGRLLTEVDGELLVLTSKTPLDTLTTYTVSVGSSLMDLHKNPVARPFQLVFSTGPQVDTLQLRGWVRLPDSLLRKKMFPMVGLYPMGTEPRVLRKYLQKLRDTSMVLPDSLPRLHKEPVLYLGQTDSLGKFHIDGIGPGRYRTAAFLDLNSNNRIDPSSEIAGLGEYDVSMDSAFHDTLYFSMADQDTSGIRISAASVQTPNLASVDFSRPLVSDSSLLTSCGLWKMDSSLYAKSKWAWTSADCRKVTLWFDSVARDSNYLIGCTAGSDSLGRRMNAKLSRLKQRWMPIQDTLPLLTTSFRMIGPSPTLDSLPTLELTYNIPVSVDSLRESIFIISGKDTLITKVNQLDPVRLKVMPGAPLPMGLQYRLVRLLRDTVKAKVDTANPQVVITAKNLGSFETISPLKVLSLQAKLPGASEKTRIELRSPVGAYTWAQQCRKDGSFRFEKIPEGNYLMQVFEDSDGDGKLSSGKLFPYQPAESWRPVRDTIRVGKDQDMLALDSLLSRIPSLQRTPK